MDLGPESSGAFAAHPESMPVARERRARASSLQVRTRQSPCEPILRSHSRSEERPRVPGRLPLLRMCLPPVAEGWRMQTLGPPSCARRGRWCCAAQRGWSGRARTRRRPRRTPSTDPRRWTSSARHVWNTSSRTLRSTCVSASVRSRMRPTGTSKPDASQQAPEDDEVFYETPDCQLPTPNG